VHLEPIDDRRTSREVCAVGRAGHLTLPPSPDAILTRAEVAAWLKINPRQVERLGIPCIDLGRKTKRYVAKDVQAWLDTYRRQPGRRASLTEPKSG